MTIPPPQLRFQPQKEKICLSAFKKNWQILFYDYKLNSGAPERTRTSKALQPIGPKPTAYTKFRHRGFFIFMFF